MRKNLFQHTVYNLMRQYGVQGDYYHIGAITEDHATGKSITSKTVYRARRMVELPTEIVRDIKLGGSNFPGAQEIDVSSVLILIDHRTLPVDFVYHPDDYIILYSMIRRQRQPGRRFNIQKVETFETNTALIATARYIEGSALNAIYDTITKDALTLTESATTI